MILSILNERNLEDVVPFELQKESYDWLGIETGANEISNLDLNLDHSEHIESWKQQIHSASEATFNIAQQALNNNPSLKKVIIMKRIPRYDNHVRSELTKYGNYIYDKLWREKGCPDNIVLGESNLDCFGDLRDLRYGRRDSQVCDYIHLRGKLGEAHWTGAVLKVFKLAFPFL